MDIEKICQRSKEASRCLALTSTDSRNLFLKNLAGLLIQNQDEIIRANQVDLEKARAANMADAMVDRLLINVTRLRGMAADLLKVLELPDPVGEEFEPLTLPNGLQGKKVRVPLGVLAAIYESRPNVTIDIAALAVKSGNSVILKGGKEANASNAALAKAASQALKQSSLPEDAVVLIEDPDRTAVLQLLQMDDYIAMVIPRGGASLHEFCRKNSRIPVITGGIGICHLFVDATADLAKSVPVIHNAKVQRPTVCNALDTVLVHRSAAPALLPLLAEKMVASGVELRVDERAAGILGPSASQKIKPAGPGDFDVEWLSLVLGIKVVDSLEEAMDHIAIHSTGHSDGILTEDKSNAQKFLRQVDSAAVYVNASTRFTDGAQLGLGAEVAISTQRLHARGPMGLRELTTYKWVLQGEYTIRG